MSIVERDLDELDFNDREPAGSWSDFYGDFEDGGDDFLDDDEDFDDTDLDL